MLSRCMKAISVVYASTRTSVRIFVVTHTSHVFSRSRSRKLRASKVGLEHTKLSIPEYIYNLASRVITVPVVQYLAN